MRASADSDFRRYNSLLFAKKSLYFEIFSLLICVGNCAKSGCGAAVSCYGIGPGSLEIAIFPVKFPVSREFAWRRVRSALRRQPSTRSARDSEHIVGENPAFLGAFRAFSTCLQNPKYGNSGENLPKVSGQNRRNSRFEETFSGDKFRPQCVVEAAVALKPKCGQRSGFAEGREEPC
ncbi:hypothetical protein SAMN05443247_05916 [Bradyrhizobium erythrophlei]|jgi:hypothetical protein|nr:hypothetical protein SAMN05443247_05916 [Bradyrhizobium erythrophlei]